MKPLNTSPITRQERSDYKKYLRTAGTDPLTIEDVTKISRDVARIETKEELLADLAKFAPSFDTLAQPKKRFNLCMIVKTASDDELKTIVAATNTFEGLAALTNL
jgi:hypothetical protein